MRKIIQLIQITHHNPEFPESFLGIHALASDGTVWINRNFSKGEYRSDEPEWREWEIAECFPPLPQHKVSYTANGDPIEEEDVRIDSNS